MSDSELSELSPDGATIENELRDVVRKIYKNGNLEELTVRRVRLSVEKNLRLEEGFLKEPQWKDKSKSIIESEAADQGNAVATVAKSPPKAIAETSAPSTKASKRSATEDGPKPGKRQRMDRTPQMAPTTERKVPPKTRTLSLESSGSELSALESDAFVEYAKDAPKQPSDSEKPLTAADQSESEMSELIDEEPKPRKKKAVAKNETKAPKTSKRKKESPTDLNPDDIELKKLQGWLVKCGIRKMWWKELKPYNSPKAKIGHLREMLSDAGMTGRYSAEKAIQIREARELQADLEAVQEGEKHWGKVEEEESGGERPRRRLARGLENLDFLIDDDGEETD